jgi:lipopolysaccharide transport system permease protein
MDHGGARTIFLRPSLGWRAIDWREIWQHRELLLLLAMRDVSVRYKQTVLGVLWAVIQPVFTILVFTIFFGRLGGLQGKTDIPYPLLTFSALLPWQLFASALGSAANSLVNNQALIGKVYFPRLLMPFAATLGGLIDFMVGMLVLVALMGGYGIRPTWRVATLPVFVAMTMVAALAVGTWLSAVNVEYRDVRHAIPFLIQIWFFVTPVVYPIAIVPSRWRTPYAVNPMVGVVEGFRWALLGTGSPPWPMLGVSALITGALLLSGLYYFRRVEKSFADLV